MVVPLPQDELRSLAQSPRSDITGVSETWWDWNALLGGHRGLQVLQGGRQARRAGGVSLFGIEGLKWSSHLPVGQLWVRVQGQTRNEDAIVGVCYRPHHPTMMSVGSLGLWTGPGARSALTALVRPTWGPASNSERAGLVGGGSAHGRGFGTEGFLRSLPTQSILWSHYYQPVLAVICLGLPLDPYP